MPLIKLPHNRCKAFKMQQHHNNNITTTTSQQQQNLKVYIYIDNYMNNYLI